MWLPRKYLGMLDPNYATNKEDNLIYDLFQTFQLKRIHFLILQKREKLEKWLSFTFIVSRTKKPQSKNWLSRVKESKMWA